MHDALLLVAAAGYLGAVVALYQSVLHASRHRRRAAVGLALLGLLFHAAAQYHHWVPLGAQEINLLNALSLCAMVVVLLLTTSLATREPLFDAGLLALPIAVLVLVAEWGIDAPGNLVTSDAVGIKTHILTSVVAFGILSIAAVYAVFVALVDHLLRRRRLNRLMRALPGLVVMEGHLFQLIAAGFLILSIALLTGLVFVNNLFEQHLLHKTVLSILAWVVFGVLLWGRRYRGWRGRVAVRLTLAGMAILLLSYFGSKLVLEVILDSHWQT